MAYKTTNLTNAYIRELLDFGKEYLDILSFADENKVPVLLPETSAFLVQILNLSRPNKILEIGTAIGYSGQLLLNNSAKSSTLTTIELRNDYIQIATDFFNNAKLFDRVNIINGDAGIVLQELKDEFDFIFLDGPKAQYIKYYPYLKQLLTSGGLLFCDNVLYDGMVSGEIEVPKKKLGLVKKIDLFLKTLCDDESFSTSILPIGDGVSLSIKK